MSQKDITEKTLIGCIDVFADIDNILLLGGKQIVTKWTIDGCHNRG